MECQLLYLLYYNAEFLIFIYLKIRVPRKKKGRKGGKEEGRKQGKKEGGQAGRQLQRKRKRGVHKYLTLFTVGSHLL